MSLQIRLTECIYVTIDKKSFNSNNNILLSTLHGYISCYACIKINSMANLTFFSKLFKLSLLLLNIHLNIIIRVAKKLFMYFSSIKASQVSMIFTFSFFNILI